MSCRKTSAGVRLFPGVIVGLLALTVFVLARDRRADCSRRDQPNLVGVSSSYLHRGICDWGFLYFVDKALQARASLCGSPGDNDPARLGLRSISTHRRTQHHDLFRRCAAYNAATPARGACVGAVLLFPSYYYLFRIFKGEAVR